MSIKYISVFLMVITFWYPSHLKFNVMQEPKNEVNIYKKVETWWDGKNHEFLCFEISGLNLDPITEEGKLYKEEDTIEIRPSSVMAPAYDPYFYYNELTSKWIKSPLERHLFLAIGQTIEREKLIVYEKMIKVVDSNTIQAFFLLDDFKQFNDRDFNIVITYKYWPKEPLFSSPNSSLRPSVSSIVLKKIVVSKIKVEDLDSTANSEITGATKEWLKKWCSINYNKVPLKYIFCDTLNQK